MISVSVSCRVHHLVAATVLALLPLAGCHSALEGTWHGTSSDRVIELRSGKAYISEGASTFAVPYEVVGDRVVLKMPFVDTVLRRTPDDVLAGMGDKLVRVDQSAALLLGSYESIHGDYRLRLNVQGQAIYTTADGSFPATYTVEGNGIVLMEGSRRIAIRRLIDGSLETPDAVLHKRS